jgi:hypothetical protein
LQRRNVEEPAHERCAVSSSSVIDELVHKALPLVAAVHEHVFELLEAREVYLERV